MASKARTNGIVNISARIVTTEYVFWGPMALAQGLPMTPYRITHRRENKVIKKIILRWENEVGYCKPPDFQGVALEVTLGSPDWTSYDLIFMKKVNHKILAKKIP